MAKPVWAILCCAAALGCGEDGSGLQPDAPIDAGDAGGVFLVTDGGRSSLVAYYSILLEPLEDAGATDVELVVTLVDPAFQCQGTPPRGLDSASFVFRNRQPGASSQTIIGRAGPVLGQRTSGAGPMTLTEVDDRYLGEGDGGPIVAPGGHVAGTVCHIFDDGTSIVGSFRAPHCALLDFVFPP